MLFYDSYLFSVDPQSSETAPSLSDYDDASHLAGAPNCDTVAPPQPPEVTL